MKYDLVFEGGGAKGMVFVGALQEFQAQGHTHGRLLGTSAGAITATLLAAGYDAAEMLAALNEKEEGHSVFAAFMGVPAPFDQDAIKNSVTRALLRSIDIPLLPNIIEDRLDDQLVELLAKQPQLRHVFSFIERGGWFSADSFIKWMERKLDSGAYNGQPRNLGKMNLAQLYQVTQVDLSLVASDTTAGRMLVLNHRTAPDCPVVWAVRMSMNIPLLWQEVVWQAEWGAYRNMDMIEHVIVDGGLLSNFPVELFVSNLPGVTQVMGPKTSENVLGFLIDETMPVVGAPPASSAQDATQEPRFNVSDLRTLQRVGSLLNTMLQAHDKMVIEAFERFVVRLPAKGYGTTEFDMSDPRREALVAAGRQTMNAYLASAAAMYPSPEIATADASQAVPKGIKPVSTTSSTADRIASRLLE